MLWSDHTFSFLLGRYLEVEFLFCMVKKVLISQSCPTPCDAMEPGSSVHGISQARKLERAATSFYHHSLSMK